MNRVLPLLASTYRQVKAEEIFQAAAVVLAKHLTVDRFEGMARAGVGLLDLLEGSTELDELDIEDGPEREYLAGLPDERVMELLEEAVPEHAAVLQRDPEFRKKIVADLRKLVGGKGT